MLKRKGTGLIIEMIAWSTCPCPLWIAPLNHEIANDTMKCGSVIETIACKEYKVIHGFGCLRRKQPYLDITFFRMHDCQVLLGRVNLHRWRAIVLLGHIYLLNSV